MDPITAVKIMGIAILLINKAYQVMQSGEPQSIDEEMKRLEEARLRPSEDVIKEADAAHPAK